MSTLHDGFSSSTFEPVAEPFRGFRAFLIDDYERRRPQPYLTPRRRLTSNEFAAGGTAHGAALRGSLRGIFMSDYVWGPGANEAVCMAISPWRATRPTHASIRAECDCGFWAYTNGDHYLSVPGPAALGIVEAWGRMIIGPHGFRAEKARIVALTFPAPLAQEEDDIPPPAATVTRATVLGGVLAWLKSWTDILASTPPGAPVPNPPTVNRAAHPWEQVTPSLARAVRRLYPKAQVYDSVTEMQAAHPLTDTTRLLDEVTAQPEPEVEGP